LVVDEKKIIKEDKIDFKLCFSLNLEKLAIIIVTISQEDYP
jgi:hypothetical protein